MRPLVTNVGNLYAKKVTKYACIGSTFEEDLQQKLAETFPTHFQSTTQENDENDNEDDDNDMQWAKKNHYFIVYCGCLILMHSFLYLTPYDKESTSSVLKITNFIVKSQ